MMIEIGENGRMHKDEERKQNIANAHIILPPVLAS
jgi:hypothetical protein